MLRPVDNGTTLTLGPGLTVRRGSNAGSPGSIGYNPNYGGNAAVSVVNLGTISADTSGRTIRIAGQSFINAGLAQATNGGVLVLASPWSNTGTLRLDGGTLDFASAFRTADLGNVQRNGGTITLSGTLNNTNAQLALNAASGPWIMQGGAIHGGTVSTAEGAKLLFTTAGGTLDAVTVNGDLDLTGNNVLVTVVNGLTLNGTATIGATGGVWSRMEFSGTQTLGGAGTVVFGDAYGPMLRPVDNGTTLTLGPGLTVRRGSNASRPGSIGYNPNYGGNAAVSVVNLGTISADTSGRTIRISGQSFSNQGDFEVATGALLDANGSLVFDGLHRLDTQPDGRVEVSGNLSGNTRASDHYLPLGTTVFDGAGTSVSPQSLEVMAQDFGMSGDGFNRNF